MLVDINHWDQLPGILDFQDEDSAEADICCNLIWKAPYLGSNILPSGTEKFPSVGHRGPVEHKYLSYRSPFNALNILARQV